MQIHISRSRLGMWTGPGDTLPKRGTAERVKKKKKKEGETDFTVQKPSKHYHNPSWHHQWKQSQGRRDTLLEFQIRYQQTLTWDLLVPTANLCFARVYLFNSHNDPLRWAPLLSHFIDLNTEAQGSQVTCQSHLAHAWLGQESSPCRRAPHKMLFWGRLAGAVSEACHSWF